MRIGIDIDGVLTDISTYLFDHSISFFKERGIELVNPKGYDVKEMYEVDDKLIGEFWLEYLAKYFSTPARYKASEIIQKLQEDGNEIIIITARGSGRESDGLRSDYTKEVTKKWLELNNIKPTKVIFSTSSKLEICRNEQIDLMIDDMPFNILEISKEIKCFCYNAIYNEDISGDNITRCYSWEDIYYKIKEITSKK